MIVEVPFEIVQLEKDSYHLFVRCLVNGDQEGEMVIDTGASKTVMDRSFVKQYQGVELNDDEIHSSGLGGDQIDAEMVRIESLRIGSLEVKDLCLALIDLSGINQMYEKYCQRRISGLLGSDFLLQNRACIDYNRSVLLLYSE